MEGTIVGEATSSLQAASPLFRLPAELRNIIYEMALPEDHPISVGTTPWYSSTTVPPGTGTQPALTRTCRAIRHEALPIFYAENVFITSLAHPINEAWMRRWLHAIGPRNRKALQQVHIEESEWHSYGFSMDDFRRAQNRFLERLQHSGEVTLGEDRYYVVRMDCLTFDDLGCSATGSWDFSSQNLERKAEGSEDGGGNEDAMEMVGSGGYIDYSHPSTLS